jgi:hypothetical protein
MVASNSSNFFYEIDFFLTISYFDVKLLALELCDFLLFFPWGLFREQAGQTNPGQLTFHSLYFFI